MEQLVASLGLLLLFTALILLALGGNSLVCAAVYFDRTLRRQPENLFLVSLAVSDLLVSVLVSWSKNLQLSVSPFVTNWLWSLFVSACVYLLMWICVHIELLQTKCCFWVIQLVRVGICSNQRSLANDAAKSYLVMIKLDCDAINCWKSVSTWFPLACTCRHILISSIRENWCSMEKHVSIYSSDCFWRVDSDAFS